MSSRRANDHFILFMFKQDLDNMKRWVLNYPNKETGGDLFGLWSDGGNAVIHVVLGPGRHCTHGDYHFYQDVSYLEKVGTLLTRDYMLGHIGEWHSHHQLRLNEPSEGDCRTVQKNFPQGACGFFLMIANIITRDEVSFSPYIFRGSQHYRAGQIKVIGDKSPFSLVTKISLNLEDEKEAENIFYEKKKGKRDDENTTTASWTDKILTFIFGDYDPSTMSDSQERQSRGHRYRNTDQWYKAQEARPVLKDIYNGLESLGGTELQFKKNDRENMTIEFVCNERKFEIYFPRNFPVCSPKLRNLSDNYQESIFLTNSFTIHSFDSEEFIEKIKYFLYMSDDLSHV